MATQPFEIIAGPFKAYVAPLGTAFPDLADSPSGSWTLLGAGGDRSIADSGVIVRNNQVLNKKRTLGSTGPRKVWRTEEDLEIEFTLLDARVETYAKALNDAAVTTTAAGTGTAGTKKIKLKQGNEVSLLALLLRGDGMSPYGEGTAAWGTQWQLDRVYQAANLETIYTKGEPVGVKFLFSALENTDGEFGYLVCQDDDEN